VLIIQNQEHFDKVREFARSVDAAVELQKQLDFLASFGGDAAKIRCYLYSDIAPHSFCWRMEHSSLDGWNLVGFAGLHEKFHNRGRRWGERSA
jgi:hypothetical protein